VNKFIIPVILCATIIVAGFAAFIPVDKAIAVHNFIIEQLNATNKILLADHDFIDGNLTEIDIAVNATHDWVILGHNRIDGNITQIHANITQIHGNVTQLHGNHTFILGNITATHDWVMIGDAEILGNLTTHDTNMAINFTDIFTALSNLDTNLDGNFTDITTRHNSIDNAIVDVHNWVNIGNAEILGNLTDIDTALALTPQVIVATASVFSGGSFIHCASDEPFSVTYNFAEFDDGETVLITPSSGNSLTVLMQINSTFGHGGNLLSGVLYGDGSTVEWYNFTASTSEPDAIVAIETTASAAASCS